MANLHLLVLSPRHMRETIQGIKGKSAGDGSEETQLVVLVAQTNRDEGTYDGIDWGGERVAKEIINEVNKYESQGRRVTLLGGLVGRYVIGILHQNKFFDNVTPGRNLLSRTGEQFFWRPLIEVLGDPELMILTVPYVTAAIESTDPFYDYRRNGIRIEFQGDYKYLIESYTPPNSTAPSASEARRPLFHRITDSMPPIPPALRFSFPYNVVVFPFLPLLLPTFVSIVLLRFSMASKKSRARLQSLEADASAGERLIDVVARFERQLEAAALEVYEDPRSPVPTSPPIDVSDVPGLSPGVAMVPKSRSASLQQPILTS
ncbi:DUF676-domain-containing protein [Pisolithus marmoratus]|nr:DUF676-domain-containing protein [Pisolithus marmoratus]